MTDNLQLIENKIQNIRDDVEENKIQLKEHDKKIQELDRNAVTVNEKIGGIYDKLEAIARNTEKNKSNWFTVLISIIGPLLSGMLLFWFIGQPDNDEKEQIHQQPPIIINIDKEYLDGLTIGKNEN